MDRSPAELARLIDHTNLDPAATDSDIQALCDEARRHGFGAVCLYPADVTTAAQALDDTRVCTVVGFPHGRDTRTTTVRAARDAVSRGADEIDMVIDQGRIRAGDTDAATADIAAVRREVPNTTLKVILETCNLSDDGIADACRAAVEADADFVKTSTGFGAHGARTDDVEVMADAVPDTMGIKAAGGIRTADDVAALLDAADRPPQAETFRVGTSAGPALLDSLDTD